MGSGGRSRQKRRRRQKLLDNGGWWKAGLLAVVGVLAIGLTVTALSARPASTSASQPLRTFSFGSERPVALQVAFIGDSWLGGSGAEPSGSDNGYAGIAMRDLQWRADYFGGGGTGYTRGNDAGEGPFQDRVQLAIDTGADVVVVQGSSNDYQATEEQIRVAASEVFRRLREGLPDASILVLGVINSPSSPPALMDASRRAVATAAQDNGATFVDGNAEGWLDQTTDFADGYHPNNEGHKKVADRLKERLLELRDSRS